MAHIGDNLLTIASGLLYDGSVATEDEVMSPTTDRLVVYLWLTLIDARLPAYVARMYAHDLQSKTLKDIQPQLSQSMESLIAELNAQEDINVHYARASYRKNNSSAQFTRTNREKNKFLPSNNSRSSTNKQCIICKAVGRSYQGHDVSSCWYISKFEKIEVAKDLQVNMDDSNPDIEDISATLANQVISQCNTNEQCNTTNVDSPEIVRKVESDISPFFTPSITITHVG